MMKYSATILLFAAAVFWSSASARPHPNPEQENLIDVFTRGVITALKENVPEPHRTILINKVHKVQYQHWDNFEEYTDYIKSMLVKYVRELGVESPRRKQDVGSDEELSIDEIVNNYFFYGAYARTLVSIAPPAHQAALLKKYEKALEKDYENVDDFEVEAEKIFEEETGLDIKKLIAEIQADEGKLAEFENKLVAEYTNALASANSEETNSSEED